jgi:hypothetical protein
MHFRGLTAPALALAAIAIVGLAAGYFSEGNPEPANRDAGIAGDTLAVRGVVQELAGESLTLTTGDGSLKVTLSPDTSIEALLRPATFEALRPGDWLNVGAVQHRQTLLVINGIVVIPQTQLQARP